MSRESFVARYPKAIDLAAMSDEYRAGFEHGRVSLSEELVATSELGELHPNNHPCPHGVARNQDHLEYSKHMAILRTSNQSLQEQLKLARQRFRDLGIPWVLLEAATPLEKP